MGEGAVFLVFGTAGGLPGQSTGVVNLDDLVAAGADQPFGTPGTAIEFVGDQMGQNNYIVGSSLGTDVTGGDFNGSGISGYSMGAWGETVNGVTNAGATYTYNGTTAWLTQAYSNADAQVYYAGDQGVGITVQAEQNISNGVDLIATGAGNNDWVHGIGTDTLGKDGDLTVQHDAVSGGAGNDFVGIIGTNFTSVNGGAGWNTLVFEGSNLTLNLTQMGQRVQNFGTFDLDNQSNTASTDPGNPATGEAPGQFVGTTQNNTLQLSLSDVLSENGVLSVANQSGTPSMANPGHMMILGTSASNATVQLDGTTSLTGSNWSNTGTQTINGITFDVYHNSTANTLADLLIEQGVRVI
jgi:hypothetical protein